MSPRISDGSEAISVANVWRRSSSHHYVRLDDNSRRTARKRSANSPKRVSEVGYEPKITIPYKGNKSTRGISCVEWMVFRVSRTISYGKGRNRNRLTLESFVYYIVIYIVLYISYMCG